MSPNLSLAGSKTNATAGLRELKQLGRGVLICSKATLAFKSHFTQQTGRCPVTCIDCGFKMFASLRKVATGHQFAPSFKVFRSRSNGIVCLNRERW